MSKWSGYLSNDMRQQIVDVLIEERLTSRASTVALLEGLSNRFIAQLPSTEGLPDNLRLSRELSHINNISKLEGGEVPAEIFLSNIRTQVQDRQRAEKINAAMLELEANAPSTIDDGDRLKLNKTQSHARFDAFADVISKHTPNSAGDPRESQPEIAGARIERELTIHRDEKLPINFALDATHVARSVFKLIVHRHFNGEPNMLDSQPDSGNGTAWIIGSGIGITNHHVFEARDQFEPAASEQDFMLQVNTAKIVADYYDADGEQRGPILGDAALLASSKELDYAIFELPTEVNTRDPLTLVPSPLLKSVSAPVQARVNVIQHPLGLPMQLAIRNNYIMAGDEQQLTYLSDTEAGSSGSPVMNDRWQVAALHIGGRENQDLDFELMGRPIKHENIGVSILAILQDIESKSPHAYQRIVS